MKRKTSREVRAFCSAATGLESRVSHEQNQLTVRRRRPIQRVLSLMQHPAGRRDRDDPARVRSPKLPVPGWPARGRFVKRTAAGWPGCSRGTIA